MSFRLKINSLRQCCYSVSIKSFFDGLSSFKFKYKTTVINIIDATLAMKELWTLEYLHVIVTQGCLQESTKYLCWSFFAKIFNGCKLLTIFLKKLHHQCSTWFYFGHLMVHFLLDTYSNHRVLFECSYYLRFCLSFNMK